MLRVIIERQLKTGKREELMPLLKEMRAAALQQPGYVTGETLVSTEDPSILATLSTWRSMDDWKAWENSEIRDKLTEKFGRLLSKKAKTTVYQISATEENKS